MTKPADRVWNIPNGITAVRMAVALILFITLHVGAYRWSLFLFTLASLTDWVDGFLARRWNQITQLGRILDPIADKVLICGTFVFLSAELRSGIAPWVAVVVLCRELTITVIRSFLEQHGRDFSANWSGKWKMGIQCVSAIVSLMLLAGIQFGNGGRAFPGLAMAHWLSWGTAAITIYSGLVYMPAAARLIRQIGAEN